MSEKKTPPPTNSHVQAPDTVPRPRYTSSAEFRTGDLERGREAVLLDLSHIPIIPLGAFQKAVLPTKLSDTALANVKAQLCNNGIITGSGSSARWTAFQTDPASSKEREDVTFRPLQAVFGSIVAAAEGKLLSSQAPTVTVEFKQNPSLAPTSDRTNTSRPDGYLMLLNQKSIKQHQPGQRRTDFWDDIAVSFEYKKANGETDRLDNDAKIIWSMHHIMRSDPCRRATFGITIENTDTRMWFSCRAVTFVSQPFNFTKDLDHLIQVFTSLAFSNDVSLGWDPSIKRVIDEVHGVQYDITFSDLEGGPVTYRTTRILSDFGADALRGRGTRVFEAYRPDKPNQKRFAIKDVWSDCDRKREAQILEEIFEEIEKQVEPGMDKVKNARRHFLTVIHYEDVKIAGATDHTLELLMRNEDLPGDCKWYHVAPYRPISKTSHISSQGHVPVTTETAFIHLPSSRIQHKVHNRIIFEQVGTPLFELNEISNMFSAIHDVAQGLKILHDVGYVHRDVSVANILVFEGHGILSDLEYAKRMSSQETHEVRTGTANFMACEVYDQEYLYGAFNLSALSQHMRNGQVLGVRPPLFRFNPIHDIESLWWVGTWCLFFHVPEDASDVNFSEQKQVLKKLFPGPGMSRSFSSVLHIDALSTVFKKAASNMEVLRLWIMQTYKTTEKDLTELDFSMLPELEEAVLEFVGLAKAATKNVKIIRLDSYRHSKRKLETSEPDEALDPNPNQKRKRTPPPA